MTLQKNSITNQDSQKSLEEATSPEMHRFGCGAFKPACLQFFNTTRWLLIFLSIGNVSVRLSTGALLPGNITTLQQRFEISLATIGLILSMNDIISIIIVPFVCYFGEKYHKGRFVSLGLLLAAVGSLMFTLPQWISEPWVDVLDQQGFKPIRMPPRGGPGPGPGPPGPGSVAMNVTHLCFADDNATLHPGMDGCSNKPPSSQWTSTPFLLFLLAQGVVALGAAPIETVGLTYLDENVTQKSSGLYLTLFHVSGMFSGVIGFSLSAAFLSIYGDFYRTSAEEIEHLRADKDSWYGAWWVGFLLAAALGFLVVIPLVAYPRELPTKGARRAKDRNLTHTSRDSEAGKEVLFGQSWASYIPALKALATNPAYVLNNIRSIITIFVMSGSITFMPLYIKYAFDLSNQESTLFGAVVMIVPALLGAVTGGLIMKCRQFTVRELITFIIGLIGVGALLFLILLNYCDTPKMAGVNIEYGGAARDWADGVQLNNSCNSGCRCNRGFMQPMCDKATGLEYFSPCHAGCKTVLLGGKQLEDCSCAEQYFPKPEIKSPPGEDGRFEVGNCKRGKGCRNRRIIVLMALAVGSFLTGIEMAPSDQIVMRSVPFSTRIVAKGVQMASLKLLGFIPGPIVFGLVLDTCCMVKAFRCGKEANCIQYSVDRMTSLLVGLTVLVRIIAMALMFLALLLFNPVDGEPWWKVAKDRLGGRTKTLAIGGKVKPSESAMTFGMNEVKSNLDEKDDNRQ